MASISNGWSGYAAPDLGAAETFYRDTLGLDTEHDTDMGLLTLKLDGPVMIYVKPDHAPATFTVLTLVAGDLDVTVDELAGRGVEFLRYPGFRHAENGVVREVGGGPAIAWCADPAGNIIGIIERPAT